MLYLDLMEVVFRRLLACLLVCSVTATVIDAQEKPNSPVLKSYRPPPDSVHIAQSDVVAQIIQAFLTSRKANAGDPIAQLEIGLRYLVGRGVERDTAKAALWIKKAADQDFLTARFDYAILAYHGWGTPWDPFASYREFKACAEEGLPEAQYVLSQFLRENLVVPRDDATAGDWLQRAADGGYAPAKDALEAFRREQVRRDTAHESRQQLVYVEFGSDDASPDENKRLLKEAIASASPEVRSALGLARYIDGDLALDSSALAALRVSADAGVPEALTVLGRCYEEGVEVPRDPVRAAMEYARAVRLDFPRASALLWRTVHDDRFLPLLRERAGREDPDARYVWAMLVSLGFDGFLTPQQALQFLVDASRQRHVPSLIELGLWYYSGRWVTRDREKGLALWRDAVACGSREAALRCAVDAVRSDDDSVQTAMGVLQRGAAEGAVLADVALG
jgi:TPR repeat protein